MKVLRIVVDEIPATCGDCDLLYYCDGAYYCPVICGDRQSKIVCDPVQADYRRSDCPLVMDGKENKENKDVDDIEEVKHGQWEQRAGCASCYYFCSECGRHIEDNSFRPYENFPYCHCGAKMDRKENEDGDIH